MMSKCMHAADLQVTAVRLLPGGVGVEVDVQGQVGGPVLPRGRVWGRGSWKHRLRDAQHRNPAVPLCIL